MQGNEIKVKKTYKKGKTSPPELLKPNTVSEKEASKLLK
jgi:hypothetical protein